MNSSDYLKEKAGEWFKKGDGDIKTAEILVKDADPPTDTACFHCQQAVEKYLKGYLTIKNIEFLKSHDLDYLLKLCKDTDNEFERHRNSVLALNKYGIEPRYPSDIPIYYSIDETKKAIELAVEVIKFVKRKGVEQKWK